MPDWFDTEGDMVVLDSTVHVDEDNITDCGVNDDQEMIRLSRLFFSLVSHKHYQRKFNNKNLSLLEVNQALIAWSYRP